MTELEAIEEEMRRAEDPVVTVPELADRMGTSDTHLRGRLRLLERAGAVGSKDVGARATAWWHVDRVTRPHVSPEDHPDQSGLEDVAADESGHRDATAESVTVDDAVDSLDLPGSGRTAHRRREAMQALLMHLRDSGDSKGSHLRELIFEHEETGYDSADSWWTNCAHPALKDLRERGHVELVDRHNGVWGWSG